MLTSWSGSPRHGSATVISKCYINSLVQSQVRLTHARPHCLIVTATGSIIITRWHEWPIPEDALLPRATKITILKNAYQYEAVPSADRVHWCVTLLSMWPLSLPSRYVNFADPNVFIAYAGPLFAQDEIQVMEHPTLAAVREHLLDRTVRTTQIFFSEARTVRRSANYLTRPALCRKTPTRWASCHGRSSTGDRPHC